MASTLDTSSNSKHYTAKTQRLFYLRCVYLNCICQRVIEVVIVVSKVNSGNALLKSYNVAVKCLCDFLL